MEVMFKKMARQYKKCKAKIHEKLEAKGYRGTTSKKLFSLFRTFAVDKNDYVPSMHVYKRNLSPIRENYQQCSI